MVNARSLEQAFEELFRKEYNNMCRYALTHLQDESLAEDVVQETFIKIWAQKKELITSPQIRFYLIKAVRNNSISELRKQKTEKLVHNGDTPEPAPEVFLTLRQQKEHENEETRLIAEALNKLPPKCKEVFLLVKMHGMSYSQAAETLEISIKTVENQMGKAIKIFKQMPLKRVILLFFYVFVKFFLNK